MLKEVAIWVKDDVSFPTQVSSPDEGYEGKSLYDSWLEKDPSSEINQRPR